MPDILPVTLPAWFPNCADPNSSMFSICTFLFLIEHEIESGPAALLMPVLFGLAVLNMFLWAVRQFSHSTGGGSSGDDD